MIRIAARAVQALRRLSWRFTGRPPGVHALPLTAAGRIVLVKLTYARDWRLPGGGSKRGESPVHAVLRELSEEIGMTRHGAIEDVSDEAKALDKRETTGHLFIVRDVSYRPSRNFEVAAVEEFDPVRLPPDVSRRWRAVIERLLGS